MFDQFLTHASFSTSWWQSCLPRGWHELWMISFQLINQRSSKEDIWLMVLLW